MSNHFASDDHDHLPLSTEPGSSKSKFPLGRLVATPGAIAALTRNGDDPAIFLARHRGGDWGDVDVADAAANAAAVTSGDRILSAYSLGDSTRIWVITEADRSATTVLLPDEY